MKPVISQARILGFHRQLHQWYAQHGRKDLPWRLTRDPYAIYISEIMLQQTQVKTVLERYYFQFLKRFPTLSMLASAKQDEVLQAWQGLGYYNRATNLHKAAKACDGALPGTAEELIALPGIGKNTAHAIAAFAFHTPVAVMEANVKRVICRVFALKKPTPDILWGKATQLLDRNEPFDYNQAMMDIGALVCTKRAPQCAACPANDICLGKASPESYPAPVKKAAAPIRHKHIIVLQNKDGKYFASPRTSKFLNGLYHFIEQEGGKKPKGKKLSHIRQQYSHFTLRADIYLVMDKGSGKNWYTLAQLNKLPVSMAEKKILTLLG